VPSTPRAVRGLATATLALAACARPLPPPPSLFPVTTPWRVALEARVEPPLASEGGRIFVASADGRLRALEAGSGTVGWAIDDAAGAPSTGAGALLVRAPDGTVLRLDPGSGRVLWRSQTGVAGALPAVVDRDLVLVGGEGLAALQLADGRQLWRSPEPARITAPPAAAGPWVYTGEEDGTLRCRDRATGQGLWSFRTGGPLYAAPAPDAQGRLLLGASDRRILSLAADRGRQSWRVKVGAELRHAPAFFEDAALFATYEDVLLSLKRGNGHLAWRAPLPSRPLSGPILLGNAVLVACQESDIVGFDARSGRGLGVLKTQAEMATPPLLLGDRLFVGLRDRSVVALKLDLTPVPDRPKSQAPRPRKSEPGRRSDGRYQP
jgi:outer membrane protein assembly factor BamB